MRLSNGQAGSYSSHQTVSAVASEVMIRLHEAGLTEAGDNASAVFWALTAGPPLGVWSLKPKRWRRRSAIILHPIFGGSQMARSRIENNPCDTRIPRVREQLECLVS